MRLSLLLFVLLTWNTVSKAQELTKVLQNTTEQQRIDLITEHINLLRAAIQHVAYHTPGYPPERPLDLFISKYAPVQVTTAIGDSVTDKKTRTAEEYFTNLHRLKPTVYDDIKINFRPSRMNIQPTEEGDGFYVLPNLEQGFIGYRKGKEAYRDITIKSVTVVFRQRADTGAFYVKIVRIDVVDKERKG